MRDSELQMLNSVMSSPRVANRDRDYLGSAASPQRSPYNQNGKRSGTTGIKSRRLFGNLIKSDGIHNQMQSAKSHHSSIHSEARSEYGMEDVDDFERMSHMNKGEENVNVDGADQEEFLMLQRSIISRARERKSKRPAGADAGEIEPA